MDMEEMDGMMEMMMGSGRSTGDNAELRKAREAEFNQLAEQMGAKGDKQMMRSLQNHMRERERNLLREMALLTSLLRQSGPGITNRYCCPLDLSVTVSDWRVSPGAGKGARAIPASAKSRITLSPVGPPTATKAVEWPPSSLMARLTFIPPPPGSVSGREQRSLRSGSIASAWMDRSTVGLSVMVRMEGMTGLAGSPVDVDRP